MRPVFVQTRNVGAFGRAMEALEEAHPEAPKMGLVTGSAGRGKTKTAIWYAAHRGAVYVRAKYHWRGNFRNLLREIVWECGHKPAHRSDQLFRQAVDLLRDGGRTVLIDEADYLDAGSLNTARDLHDEAGVPVVLIGVSKVTEAVLREQAVWSRVAQTVPFEDLAREEIPGILDQLCEVPLSEEAVELIAAEAKMMRDLIRYILHVEKVWRGRTQAAPGAVVRGFKARVLRGRSAA